MFKVVIVDDEQVIRNGLRDVVDWAKYDCEVAAAAGDAESGINAVRNVGADILFTDIRMPGIDGLSMVSALRAEFPKLEITVLTAFSDFEYARRAIKAGVRRYLLKPSKMPEIYEALETMTTRLKTPKDGAKEDDGIETDHIDSFVVRNAVEYIRAHFRDKMTLQDVADHTYVSQWHLSKLLKKHTGENFVDLLHASRINAAKQLLKEPSLRISEIAERVGYSDAAHFSKVFRKVVGVSAGEYRNRGL